MDKTVPNKAAMLLDFIRKTEVGTTELRGYDVIYGNNQNKLPKPITKMTIDELIAAQPSFTKRFKSSASGGYQFMRATLQGLKTELKLRGTQIFDPDLQDRLGYHLLKRRGYDGWVSGKLSDVSFAKQLAQEWASFPVLTPTKGAHQQLKRGQSYYDGDALNKALVKPEEIEKLLRDVKKVGDNPVIFDGDNLQITHTETPNVSEPENPLKSKRGLFWTAVFSGTPLAAIGVLHWSVQLAIVVGLMGISIYSIYSMPYVRDKIKRLIEDIL